MNKVGAGRTKLVFLMIRNPLRTQKQNTFWSKNEQSGGRQNETPLSHDPKPPSHTKTKFFFEQNEQSGGKQNETPLSHDPNPPPAHVTGGKKTSKGKFA